MDNLKRCPFCGGTASMRGKVQSTKLQVYGHDEPGVLYFDDAAEYRAGYRWHHRYGYQCYCTRCYVKKPYVWGEWHNEEDDPIGGKYQAWQIIDKDEKQTLKEKAAAAWNMRKGE